MMTPFIFKQEKQFVYKIIIDIQKKDLGNRNRLKVRWQSLKARRFPIFNNKVAALH